MKWAGVNDQALTGIMFRLETEEDGIIMKVRKYFYNKPEKKLSAKSVH
jgi:hypothetical protein